MGISGRRPKPLLLPSLVTCARSLGWAAWISIEYPNLKKGLSNDIKCYCDVWVFYDTSTLALHCFTFHFNSFMSRCSWRAFSIVKPAECGGDPPTPPFATAKALFEVCAVYPASNVVKKTYRYEIKCINKMLKKDYKAFSINVSVF